MATDVVRVYVLVGIDECPRCGEPVVIEGQARDEEHDVVRGVCPNCEAVVHVCEVEITTDQAAEDQG